MVVRDEYVIVLKDVSLQSAVAATKSGSYEMMSQSYSVNIIQEYEEECLRCCMYGSMGEHTPGP